MASHNVPRPAIIEVKTEQSRLREQNQIDEYRALVDLIDVKITEHQYTLQVLELTSKLLSKNPEYYTVWNARRRLLTCGLFPKLSASSSPLTASQSTSQIGTTTTSSADVSSSITNSSTESKEILDNFDSQTHRKNGTTLELIKSDLGFIFPLMIQYPKCYWIWNYRLWLLKEGNARLETHIARDLWMHELALVGKMLVRDSRNFHGWGYRRNVVAELESPKLNGFSMAEAEFEYTTKMIKANLSNFSAWHRRSKLIPKLLNERKADDATRHDFLNSEFELITEAIYTDAYPYAQSVWFYYQFLMSTLIEPTGSSAINPNCTLQDRIVYLSKQLISLKDMLDGAEDCKWIYDALLEYTLVLCRMREREATPEERQDCLLWLSELRKLDPLRNGRWGDFRLAGSG
ncbi:geranylgeranyl transferas-like protein type II alpha subunit [Calycina marina]|uniref:Geranylgeranyl transferase type-2 subunit alpha n=1 Tax=Calycina marina TaxID=1763456 RepID=A0A9P7YYT8_9HELO|nr:geranylgeranyl transferas-like protein type II alpha subunit [Calycina marina]